MPPRLLMLLKARWKYVATAVLLALAFASGRFLAPTKVQVKTVEKVVTVDRVVEKRVEVQAESKAKVVYRDRTIIQKQDGTTERRNVRLESDSADTGSASGDDSLKEVVRVDDRASEKTVERYAPDWNIGVMTGPSFGRSHGATYGAMVERRVLGPIWLGAWGMSSKEAGIIIGLQF